MTPRVYLVGLLAAIATITATPSGASPTEVSSPAASEIRPGLFSTIASGVGRIQVRACSGRLLGSGTGFLIGERVLMTARHVVEVKGACRYQVTLAGKSYGGERIIYWYTAGARDLEAADVATLKLSGRSSGYIFSFGRRTPNPRTTIAVVGFPLGNPLSLNQGPLIQATRERGIPVLVVRIATAKGSSGSAFLDPEGNVVGILQRGLVAGPGEGGIITPAAGEVWGVNLVRWWGPQIVKDLCRVYRQGGIPGCAGAAPTNCAARDRNYLDKLSRPHGAYVTRWNAWIDSGEPLDESFRPTLDALLGLWLNNPDDLACSPGAKRVASLINGLQPGLDQIGDLLNQLLPLPVGDPARAPLEAQLDGALSALDARLQRIEDGLERLGFFRH